MFVIEDELKKLPTTPGVYMHKDSLGEIIYVGKAINLRNRVRSYFRDTARHDPKVRAMVANIAEFDYIKCATELEALILECNLIKKYLPKYNILLKDDKSYPFIEITVSEEFPRVLKTRQLKRGQNRYFGPYTDGTAVWQMIRMIGDMYPLKRCKTQRFPENARPCLNYFIGKCKGVCIGAVDREEYAAMIGEITDILEGRDAKLIKALETRMNEAAEELNYEEAATCRDYIRSLRSLGETQRAMMQADRDIDILIPLRTERNTMVSQYRVRDGKLIGREVIHMNDSGAESAEELIPAFIKQVYTESIRLPREVLLANHVPDEALLTELLNRINADNAASGTDTAHKTKITVPERGEKRAVLELAKADSLELVKSLDERAEREASRRNALRDRMTELILEAAAADGITVVPIEEGDDREYRVEAYDISNTNGVDTVAAMVVYEGRKPLRNDYRKFKVKTAEGDDYGSLQEVLYRRLKRAKAGDAGFDRYPDVFFIDGGLGQVHAVKKVVDAFRVPIPVVGLAKDDAHRTRAAVFSDGHELPLAGDKLLYSYAGNIQEEVHRFAITYHRSLRGNRVTRSALEEIPGIGPARRRELLAHFKSVEAIKHATYEELLAVPGMNRKAAESIMNYFQERKSST